MSSRGHSASAHHAHNKGGPHHKPSTPAGQPVKSEKDKEREKEELLRQTSEQLLQGMASLVWTKVDCLVKDGEESHRPKPRSCHTLTVIGTNGFLFGGMTDNTANIFDEDYDVKPSNEIFKLDLSNKAEVLWIR